MRDGVAVLLKPPGHGVRGSTLNGSPSSEIEGEVLETLRRSAGNHPSLTELKKTLLSSFTELEIQNGIISLLERGVIQLVYVEDRELIVRVG